MDFYFKNFSLTLLGHFRWPNKHTFDLDAVSSALADFVDADTDADIGAVVE